MAEDTNDWEYTQWEGGYSGAGKSAVWSNNNIEGGIFRRKVFKDGYAKRFGPWNRVILNPKEVEIPVIERKPQGEGAIFICGYIDGGASRTLQYYNGELEYDSATERFSSKWYTDTAWTLSDSIISRRISEKEEDVGETLVDPNWDASVYGGIEWSMYEPINLENVKGISFDIEFNSSPKISKEDWRPTLANNTENYFVLYSLIRGIDWVKRFSYQSLTKSGYVPPDSKPLDRFETFDTAYYKKVSEIFYEPQLQCPYFTKEKQSGITIDIAQSKYIANHGSLGSVDAESIKANTKVRSFLLNHSQGLNDVYENIVSKHHYGDIVIEDYESNKDQDDYTYFKSVDFYEKLARGLYASISSDYIDFIHYNSVDDLNDYARIISGNLFTHHYGLSEKINENLGLLNRAQSDIYVLFSTKDFDITNYEYDPFVSIQVSGSYSTFGLSYTYKNYYFDFLNPFNLKEKKTIGVQTSKFIDNLKKNNIYYDSSSILFNTINGSYQMDYYTQEIISNPFNFTFDNPITSDFSYTEKTLYNLMGYESYISSWVYSGYYYPQSFNFSAIKLKKLKSTSYEEIKYNYEKSYEKKYPLGLDNSAYLGIFSDDCVLKDYKLHIYTHTLYHPQQIGINKETDKNTALKIYDFNYEYTYESKPNETFYPPSYEYFDGTKVLYRTKYKYYYRYIFPGDGSGTYEGDTGEPTFPEGFTFISKQKIYDYKFNGFWGVKDKETIAYFGYFEPKPFFETSVYGEKIEWIYEKEITGPTLYVSYPDEPTSGSDTDYDLLGEPIGTHTWTLEDYDFNFSVVFKPHYTIDTSWHNLPISFIYNEDLKDTEGYDYNGYKYSEAYSFSYIPENHTIYFTPNLEKDYEKYHNYYIYDSNRTLKKAVSLLKSTKQKNIYEQWAKYECVLTQKVLFSSIMLPWTDNIITFTGLTPKKYNAHIYKNYENNEWTHDTSLYKNVSANDYNRFYKKGTCYENYLTDGIYVDAQSESIYFVNSFVTSIDEGFSGIQIKLPDTFLDEKWRISNAFNLPCDTGLIAKVNTINKEIIETCNIFTKDNDLGYDINKGIFPVIKSFWQPYVNKETKKAATNIENVLFSIETQHLIEGPEYYFSHSSNTLPPGMEQEYIGYKSRGLVITTCRGGTYNNFFIGKESGFFDYFPEQNTKRYPINAKRAYDDNPIGGVEEVGYYWQFEDCFNRLEVSGEYTFATQLAAKMSFGVRIGHTTSVLLMLAYDIDKWVPDEDDKPTKYEFTIPEGEEFSFKTAFLTAELDGAEPVIPHAFKDFQMEKALWPLVERSKTYNTDKKLEEAGRKFAKDRETKKEYEGITIPGSPKDKDEKDEDGNLKGDTYNLSSVKPEEYLPQYEYDETQKILDEQKISRGVVRLVRWRTFTWREPKLDKDGNQVKKNKKSVFIEHRDAIAECAVSYTMDASEYVDLFYTGKDTVLLHFSKNDSSVKEENDKTDETVLYEICDGDTEIKNIRIPKNMCWQEDTSNEADNLAGTRKVDIHVYNLTKLGIFDILTIKEQSSSEEEEADPDKAPTLKDFEVITLPVTAKDAKTGKETTFYCVSKNGEDWEISGKIGAGFLSHTAAGTKLTEEQKENPVKDETKK